MARKRESIVESQTPVLTPDDTETTPTPAVTEAVTVPAPLAVPIEQILERRAAEKEAKKADAWRRYVENLNVGLKSDNAAVTFQESDLDEIERLLGLTTDQIRAHAKIIAEVREADRRAGEVQALNEITKDAMVDRSAADDKLKEQTKLLQEECRQTRLRVARAQDDASAAGRVVELGERHKKLFPFLFDASFPSPHLASGKQQLDDQMSALEKELRTAIDTLDDSRRAQIERQISSLNDVILHASRLS